MSVDGCNFASETKTYCKMRTPVTILSMCIATLVAYAQGNADIEVSYKYEYPNYRTAARGSESQYILRTNARESKFFSPKTEYLDSLQSAPDGVAKLNEMTRNAAAAGKFDDIPRVDGSYYVVKEDDRLFLYETAGMDKLYSEEPLPEIAWEICDSTKTVLGYECVKAIADFHGRKWIAWFVPEIPIQNGPWKLSGLPGLILEAESEDGFYLFSATGIQHTSKPIGPVYLADRYERVGRKELLKAKRSYYDNPLGSIDARFGGEVKILTVHASGKE